MSVALERLHEISRERDTAGPADGGKLIVLTAPLTEAIDHAGYFIQMAMASIPIWMEGVINRKYPKWREVEHYNDGSAKYMPAGVRLVEKSLERVYTKDDIVSCYPQDLEKFVGPNTRVIAVSTHSFQSVQYIFHFFQLFRVEKWNIAELLSNLVCPKYHRHLHHWDLIMIIGSHHL